ncbi:MAG: ATP-binding protein [Anaerolineales bacterium]|jgi:histidine kinase
MLRWIRTTLWAKLFLSYLIVILVSVLVLLVAAGLALPGAFNRHLLGMDEMMGKMMPGMMQGMGLRYGERLGLSGGRTPLFLSFRGAFLDALGLSLLASFAVALAASLLISRRLTAPLHALRQVSQRIAAGRYSERVKLPSNLSKPENLDELGLLAVNFNQMAEQLEQTEAMRRQLIGDVAHELRTPLTAIKGSMEGLIDGVLPAEPETFQQIYREADRLQRLVLDLEELSRVEGGAYSLKRKLVSMEALINSVVQRLKWQFEEKGVRLTVNAAENLPLAKADEDRIGQVLINLLGNALQYTPEGGEVRIAVTKQYKEIQVMVQDTGIGIPPEHLDKIFTRFYRVDKSRSRAHGGSGIGLTIAKHWVEAHGGRIWAQSEGEGKGSVFTFTLPLY